jgi:aminoglycoside phosphotransferase (APT) family kinase protein
MNRNWQAEREVDTATAERLIKTHFPALSPVRAKLQGEGWDNTVYLVNDKYIFRFPRRQVAVPLIKTETQLLGMIRQAVSVPVPVPEFYAPSGDEDYPWPFMGYVRLPGVTACQLELDPAQRQDISLELARFLAALHALPINKARLFGAGLDPIGRYEFATRMEKASANLFELVELGVLRKEMAGALEELLNQDRHLQAPDADTLVHGDLYVRHMLVDNGRLSAIIDWGDVHIGTPATDLAIVHTFVPPELHSRFFAIYGQVSEQVLGLARFRAITHTLNVMLYAHYENQAGLLRESRRAAANILDSV